jgi:hypothetical protein
MRRYTFAPIEEPRALTVSQDIEQQAWIEERMQLTILESQISDTGFAYFFAAQESKGCGAISMWKEEAEWLK